MFIIVEKDESGRWITPVMSPPPGLEVKINGKYVVIENVNDNPYWMDEVIRRAMEAGEPGLNPEKSQFGDMFLSFSSVAK